MIKGFLIDPFVDLFKGLEAQLPPERKVLPGAALMLIGLVASWFIYVPIHELLHAWGCLLAGGDVTTLEIQVIYGGELLARVFDYVTPGGEYAGRLSGFDDHGSDIIYLVTVFMPFTLSIAFGVILLRRCAHSYRPAVYGVAVVLGLAPLYNLTGDYHEMASILITRAVSATGMLELSDLTPFRSDDSIKLIKTMFHEPETLGIGMQVTNAVAAAIVVGSVAIAVLLALATYRAGVWVDAIANRVWPRNTLESPQDPSSADDITKSHS